MRAETVSVGTELLLGQTVDTNAARLGSLLAECGIDHFHRQVVGDNLGRLTEALRLALGRATMVITIGGLGPTEDDLTREAVAAATGLPLVQDPGLLHRLKAEFSARGLTWLDSQARQTYLPEGAEAIPNPKGTAPGAWVPLEGGKVVVCLPGPPKEFNPMVESWLRTRLTSMGHTPLASQTVRVAGMGESMVEERLRDLVSGGATTVATYAKTAEVHVRVSSRDAAAVSNTVHEVRRRLGDYVYAVGGASLPETVVERLIARSETLAVAESCTGGLLGGAVTSVAGSSAAFLGGFLTYSNELKASLLGVREDTLAVHGAVSEECALEMAVGARSKTGASWALSVTGIAGPEGGSAEKPVGLVWFGLAGADGVQAHKSLFHGDREAVRERSVVRALDLLRRTLG